MIFKLFPPPCVDRNVDLIIWSRSSIICSVYDRTVILIYSLLCVDHTGDLIYSDRTGDLIYSV